MQTRSKRGGKIGSTSSTTSSKQPKPAPKPKKRKEAPTLLNDEPTPPPSDKSESNSETETDEEIVHREEAGTDDPMTELAKKMSLDSLKEDEERRKALIIKDVDMEFGDEEHGDEDEQHQLVDKRKLNSIIVDTRNIQEHELH